jgi:hypothetical protein
VSRFLSRLHITGQEDGMNKLTSLVLLLATLVFADAAQAQQLDEPYPAAVRWDVAGQAAWVGRNRTDLGSDWDHWYNAAAFNLSAARFWTPHLKTELEFGAGTEGTLYGNEEPVPIPGQRGPYYRLREHKLQESTLTATTVYQFLDNQWVHPFAGVGIELARERHRADELPPTIGGLTPTTSSFPVPGVPAIDRISYSVRPVVTGGLKFYVNERAFIRTDVRTSFSTAGPLALEWSGGVGLDF